MIKTLLVGLIVALVVRFQAIPFTAQIATTNAAVGKWDWSFSDKPSDDKSDLVRHGKVTLNDDRSMEWDGNRPPDKGKWEGPMPIAVLLRWDKGDIDMLALTDDGKTLEGTNQDRWQVRGTKQGAGDTESVDGTWNWAFAKSGNPVPCGIVTFKLGTKKMEWKPPVRLTGCGTWNPSRVDPGSYEGPTKQALLLRWDKGDIDMLALTDNGKTLEGKNKKGLLVKGEKSAP